VPEKLLTTGQVADALGISARSIARWAREGKLTPALITAGGQYRFRLDEVKEQLRELRQRSE